MVFRYLRFGSVINLPYLGKLYGPALHLPGLTSHIMNKLSIYYTDDDGDDLEFFREAVGLMDADVDLFTHTSGDSFLNAINSSKLANSIAFLDVNMPGKNGLEVLSEIRQRTELNDLPVIVYSTSNSPDIIQKSMDLGANLYAVKPNTFGGLRQLIEKVVAMDWATVNQPHASFLLTA